VGRFTVALLGVALIAVMAAIPTGAHSNASYPIRTGDRAVLPTVGWNCDVVLEQGLATSGCTPGSAASPVVSMQWHRIVVLTMSPARVETLHTPKGSIYLYTISTNR